MKTSNIDLKKFEYIVISLNSCGHTERYYEAVPASMTSSLIDEYVREFYGSQSGQKWRTATPAERENNIFEISEITAPFLTKELI